MFYGCSQLGLPNRPPRRGASADWAVIAVIERPIPEPQPGPPEPQLTNQNLHWFKSVCLGS